MWTSVILGVPSATCVVVTHATITPPSVSRERAMVPATYMPSVNSREPLQSLFNAGAGTGTRGWNRYSTRGRPGQFFCGVAFSLIRFVIFALRSWSAFILPTFSALCSCFPCSFSFSPYLHARIHQFCLSGAGRRRRSRRCAAVWSPVRGAGGEALEAPHWRIHGAASLPLQSTPRFRSRRCLAADRPAAPSPPAALRLHLAPPPPAHRSRSGSSLYPCTHFRRPDLPPPLLSPRSATPRRLAATPSPPAAAPRSRPPHLRCQAETHTCTTRTPPPRPCYTETHTQRRRKVQTYSQRWHKWTSGQYRAVGHARTLLSHRCRSRLCRFAPLQKAE